MRIFVVFSLTLNFLFYGAHTATFTFTNNCPYTVWPATLSGNGPQLSTTGFQLPSKATLSLTVPAPFSGRFWARTQCSNNTISGKFTCETGDCGSGQKACNGAGGVPPVSLVEFTLAPNNGQDFYDVSLVDGFNLPVSVSPLGGSGNNCTTTTCTGNVNTICPSELSVKGSDGTVVACKSACEHFKQPEYCCTGSYGTPNTCKPTKFSVIFKEKCPQAYSYAYDDKSSIFSCTGGANYAITFCP